MTVVNLRGADDNWEVLSRVIGIYGMSGVYSSESEAAMVKGVIDGFIGPDTVLVRATSDIE